MSLITRVENDYNLWSTTATDVGWSIYDGNSKAAAESQDNAAIGNGVIYKSFVLSAPANNGTLITSVRRDVGQSGAAPDIGSSRIRIRLQKPVGSALLYDASGALAWTIVLNGLDITAHLDAAGTYTLQLIGDVHSAEAGGVYDHSFARFGTVDLKADTDPPEEVKGISAEAISTTRVRVMWNPAQGADSYNVYSRPTAGGAWTKLTGLGGLNRTITGLTICTEYDFKVSATNVSGESAASDIVVQRTNCSYVKTLTEACGVTDTLPRSLERTLTEVLGITDSVVIAKFISLLETCGMVDTLTTQLSRTYTKTLSEACGAVELLTILRSSPYATSQEKLLAGKTDSKLYVFDTGTEEGIYDTDDLDFEDPTSAKTLSKVMLTSHAVSPHTVKVYVSVDGGVTYTSIGQTTIQRGIEGYVYPWVTSEKFRLRFKGAGLYLDAIHVLAVPRGPEVVESSDD